MSQKNKKNKQRKVKSVNKCADNTVHKEVFITNQNQESQKVCLYV